LVDRHGLITALGAPALGAAAAFAYGVASAAGLAALDPPAPDIDFATTVDLSSYQVAVPKSALSQFFTAASRAMELTIPFNTIQGKVLGAQRAQDAAAIDKQHASLTEALALMDVHHLDMQKALPAAQQELEALLADKGFVDALNTWGQPDTSPQIWEAILKSVDGNKELADVAMKLLQSDAVGLIERLQQIRPLDTLAQVVGASVLTSRAEVAALI
jgi:hypothetical protein